MRPTAHHLLLSVLATIALAMPRSAAAGWSADTTLGNPVCVAPGDVLDPIMVTDGDGGFIVLWTDYRKPTFDPDLYCRRVSASGDTLWGANGTVVCDAPGLQILPTMIPDGAGGAFMAWMDLRTGGGSQGYYLQHIGSDGLRRWAANGINRTAGFNSQYGPKICRDSTGGIFLAFASGNPGTQIQRLDSLGTKRLSAFPPAEGPVLHANPSAPLGIVPDGAGGAIVALGHGPSGLVDIAAQRITSAGALLWPAGGATVCNATGTQSAVEMVPDGSGGAILAWEDNRSSNTDIYAQRIEASGNALWAANGVAVCGHSANQSGVKLRAFAGASVVALWRDSRHLPATSLYAQRLTSDGGFAWPTDGVLACGGALAIERYSIAAGLGDSTLVAWNTTSGSNADVFAQALDGAGNRVWSEYGTTVCRGPFDQTSSASVSDGSGGLHIAYRDARMVGDPNLHASHIGPNGLPGPAMLAAPEAGPPRTHAIVGVPNPAHGFQRFAFVRPLSSAAVLEVLDLAGRRQCLRRLRAGASEWSWDGRDDSGVAVRPGVYLLRMRGDRDGAIARIVRLE